MEKLLEINGLKSWYGLSQALFDVNLEINQGEVVALLGRNGMGKSTTIRSICGLISNYEGDIKFKNIFRSQGSAALLMNINNGDILSLVSLPDFNINFFT